VDESIGRLAPPRLVTFSTTQPQQADPHNPEESPDDQEYGLLLRASNGFAKQGPAHKGRDIDKEGNGRQHDKQKTDN
jgi:hypothetical protein